MTLSPLFQCSHALCRMLTVALTLTALPTAAQNAAPLAVGGAAATAARQVAAILSRGDYDATMERSTQFLEKFPDDPSLLYFRGYAAQTLGDYASAHRDLSVLGDFIPFKGWKNAQELVSKIESLQALAPVNATDIEVQGRVVFHVFYDEENPWASAVVKLLPRAYEINRELLGQGPKPASVWIFSDQVRYKQFMALRGDNIPVSWLWAGGDLAGVYFCQNLPKMSPQDTNSAYFRTTVAHEFNHCAVQRVTTNITMPPWFVEGLAMSTAFYLAPKETERFRREFEQAWQANALLSSAQVNDRKYFQDTVEQGIAGKSKADPYAQGWSMTQYFLLLVPSAQVTQFLEEVHQSRDFDKALLKFTGLTPQEFFDAWHAN